MRPTFQKNVFFTFIWCIFSGFPHTFCWLYETTNDGQQGGSADKRVCVKIWQSEFDPQK